MGGWLSKVKKASPGPSLLGLPNELLVRVAQYLPSIYDIHDLRLVGNDRLARAGLDAVHQRMTTIFIEPTRKSIKDFRDICACPARAYHIHEIVFIAGLSSGTAAELRDAQEFWELEAEVRERRGIGGVTDVVKTLVVERYAILKAEQEALVEEGALDAALIDIIPLLPQLKKITFEWIPRILSHAWDRWYPVASDEEAYNVPMVWREVDEYSSETSQQTSVYDLCSRAMYQQRFGARHEVRFEDLDREEAIHSPVSVFRSLAHSSSSIGSRSVELHFDNVPTSILDNAFVAFAADEGTLMKSAIAQVPAISLRDHHRTATGTVSPRDFEIGARWQNFVGMAKRLKSLHLDSGVLNHGSYRGALSAIFASKQTWPELESLWCNISGGWYLDGDRFLQHFSTYDYHDRSLKAFLERHRKTIKDLRFINAMGIVPGPYQDSAASMLEVLNFMRFGLPQLQTARIAVMLDPHHRLGPRTPWARPNGKEDDLQAAADTDLDQLARDLKVQRYIEDFDRGDEGSGARFKYEFGKYVLGNPTVDRTAEVQHAADSYMDRWPPG